MSHFEKYTKEECEYGPGDWPKECGTCAHYTELSKATHRSPEGQGNCKIVVGRIDPTGLCKFHVYAKGKESLEGQEGGEEVRAPSKYISQRQINEFLKWNEEEGRLDQTSSDGKVWCETCKMWHYPSHSH